MTETAPRDAGRFGGGETEPSASIRVAARASSGRLPHPRRYFAIVAFVLLCLPLVFGVLRPDDPEYVYEEGRRLQPAPTFPTSLVRWIGCLTKSTAICKTVSASATP